MNTVSGGYISLNHIRPLLDYLETHAYPIDGVLRALGITPDQRQDMDIVIDAKDEDEAFSVALALTGDPDMGLRAGAEMTVANLGPLGHLLMASSSMADVFNFHTKYGEVVGNGLRPEYIFAHDEVCLVLHRRMPRVYKNCRQVLDYALTGWLVIARWLVGQDFLPTLVELTYAQPLDVSAHNEILRCPLAFGRPLIKVHFSLRALSMPFRHTYPGLQTVLVGALEQRLPKSTSVDDVWMGQVLTHLSGLLASPSLSLPTLAHLMGMTTRSLQRALKARDTTYMGVLDLSRKTAAQHWVKDDALSLGAVSQALGFAEQSAFQRAFKRWYACTPGAYRKGDVPRH